LYGQPNHPVQTSLPTSPQFFKSYLLFYSIFPLPPHSLSFSSLSSFFSPLTSLSQSTCRASGGAGRPAGGAQVAARWCASWQSARRPASGGRVGWRVEGDTQVGMRRAGRCSTGGAASADTEAGRR
jgi:hypothetical protein